MNMKLLLLLAAITLVLSCSKSENEATPDPAPSAEPKSQAGQLGGVIIYDVPQGWIREQPGSQFRTDQFRLPGVDGAGDAELVVSHFNGKGGALAMNLERWYSQIKQPDGRATADVAELETMKQGDVTVNIMYCGGTYLRSTSPMMTGPKEEMPDYAVIAAMAEPGPWFYKLVGPRQTVDHWRDSFRKYVETFRLD